MLLQIHISRSTVNVSTSRGTPPSTLSVKGQIETVRVKGTVENSACLQWLESDSSVVFFSIMNSGSLQVKLLWSFENQKAINAAKCLPTIFLPCLFHTQSWNRFCNRAAKNQMFRVCVLVGWTFFWLIVALIVTVSPPPLSFSQAQKTESVDNKGEWIVMKNWGWFYVPLGATFKSYFYQVFCKC